MLTWYGTVSYRFYDVAWCMAWYISRRWYNLVLSRDAWVAWHGAVLRPWNDLLHSDAFRAALLADMDHIF